MSSIGYKLSVTMTYTERFVKPADKGLTKVQTELRLSGALGTTALRERGNEDPTSLAQEGDGYLSH